MTWHTEADATQDKAILRKSPHSCVSYRNRGWAVKLRVRGFDRIAQHANTVDADLDDVPCDKRADPSGRAGGNQVSGIESHHPGDPAQEKRHWIDHERSPPRLTEGSVDTQFHQDIQWVEYSLDVRANGTKGIEAFGARELHVAFLEVARGDVVQAAVAKQIAQRLLGVFQLRTAPANDQGKLTFVFDALRLRRQNNRLARANDRRRRLKKNERLLGDVIPKFCGVRRIITPDAHNFSGIYGSQQTNVSNLPG